MTLRTLTAFLIILSLSVESTFAAFSDTSLSFYRDAITTLSDEGAISGFGDGTFGPEKSITRAEILKVYLKAKGTPLTEAQKTRCFRDVATTMWYHAYICEGAKLGIVKGFADGRFGPDMPVTTLEALAMGLRLYGLAPTTVSSPWYTSYQNFAEQNGILDSASYSLVTPISRGKASELILKIREYNSKKSLVQNLSKGCVNPGSLGSTNTVNIAGKDRSYILYVPPGYTSGKAVGLVVALHGRTNSNAMVQGYMGLEGSRGYGGGGRRGGGSSSVSQSDFIVAYPAGLDAGGGSRSWSAAENVTFFDTIVRDIGDNYCVDRSEVFLVAHSLGAWFASKLACVRGDVIRGIGIVGGGSWTSPCAPTPTAALIYQNPNDQLSSPASARTTERVMKNINICGATTEDVMIGSLSCKKWKDCSTGNPVVWCENYPTLGGDPHSWPNSGGGDILNFFRGL